MCSNVKVKINKNLIYSLKQRDNINIIYIIYAIYAYIIGAHIIISNMSKYKITLRIWLHIFIIFDTEKYRNWKLLTYNSTNKSNKKFLASGTNS